MRFAVVSRCYFMTVPFAWFARSHLLRLFREPFPTAYRYSDYAWLIALFVRLSTRSRTTSGKRRAFSSNPIFRNLRLLFSVNQLFTNVLFSNVTQLTEFVLLSFTPLFRAQSKFLKVDGICSIVVVVEQKQADENPLLYEFEIKRYTRWQKNVDDDNVYGD